MLQPLAKIPLMFLSDPAVSLGTSIYETLPWINGPFRDLCGLKPLRPSGSKQSEDADEQDNPYANVADGFVLADTATRSMAPKSRACFTNQVQQNVSRFLTDVYKHALQLRNSGPRKRRRRRTAKDDESPDSDEETFIDRVEHIPNFSEFKETSLAMLNRPGGPIQHLLQIMQDMDRTPMTAWRNYIYTSHTLPSYTDTAQSPAEQEEQRQNDIDRKKKELKFHNPPAIGKYLDDRLTVRAANALFGASAFMPSGDIMFDIYQKVTTSLVRRAWERASHGTRSTLKKGTKNKKLYQDALPVAMESPSPFLLKEASRCLKEWKEIAKITGEDGEPAFTTEVKALENLWGELDYPAEPDLSEDSDKKGRRPKKKKQLVMATKEQMDAAYADYREQHFSDVDSAITEVTEALGDVEGLKYSDADDSDAIIINLLEGTDNRDLGVADFAQTPLDEIIRLLGLTKTGCLPFTTPSLKTTWYQYVGIAAMLQHMFTINIGDSPLPSLLCDDVGLGKTVQILGTICMLVHCRELQQAGRPFPPLINNQFFAGLEKIPDLPSIIVVPLSLMAQWCSQINHFTPTGAFQVIVYSKENYNPVEFFERGGKWDEIINGKTCSPHRTIILVSIPTIVQEARKYSSGSIDRTAAGRARAFRGDIMDLDPNAPTILNRRFLFFGGDEVHNFRNRGWAQLAAQQISANSLVRVGASATLIFTGSLDIVAIGAFLRVMAMIGDAGYALGTAMLRSIRERRKEFKRKPVRPFEDNGSLSTTNEVQSLQDGFLTRRMEEIRAQKNRAFYIHCEAIDMAKVELIPIIIRRTARSQDPNGKRILDREAYHESIAWAGQRPVEREAFEEHMRTLMQYTQDAPGDAKEMGFIWKNFLLKERKVTFHWRLLEWDPTTEPIWESWTLENLEEMASSKILTAVSLVEHYQNPNAKPPHFNIDGTRDLVKEAECDFRPAKKPRKVIIFVMYTVDRKMTKKALDVKGFKSVEYDGRMSSDNRDQAIKQFEEDDSIRVLLMSNVGTTGLNLTVASVLIFLNVVWSGMDSKQTIGRVWRPGQTESVAIHPVYVAGTADVLVAGLAGDKLHMLDHLYDPTAIANKVFYSLGEGYDELEPDPKTPTEAGSRVSKSKVPTRTRKVKENTKPETDTNEERPLKKARTSKAVGQTSTPGPSSQIPQATQSILPAEEESGATAAADASSSHATPIAETSRRLPSPSRAPPNAPPGARDSVSTNSGDLSAVDPPIPAPSSLHSPPQLQSDVVINIFDGILSSSRAQSPAPYISQDSRSTSPGQQPKAPPSTVPQDISRNELQVSTPSTSSASTSNQQVTATPPSAPSFSPRPAPWLKPIATSSGKAKPHTQESQRVSNTEQPAGTTPRPLSMVAKSTSLKASAPPNAGGPSNAGGTSNPRATRPVQRPGQFRAKGVAKSTTRAPQPVIGNRIMNGPTFTSHSIGAPVRDSDFPPSNTKEKQREDA